jgi:hypothetical protein
MHPPAMLDQRGHVAKGLRDKTDSATLLNKDFTHTKLINGRKERKKERKKTENGLGWGGVKVGSEWKVAWGGDGTGTLLSFNQTTAKYCWAAHVWQWERTVIEGGKGTLHPKSKAAWTGGRAMKGTCHPSQPLPQLPLPSHFTFLGVLSLFPLMQNKQTAGFWPHSGMPSQTVSAHSLPQGPRGTTQQIPMRHLASNHMAHMGLITASL